MDWNRELESTRAMWCKAGLFAVAGLVSAALVVFDSTDWRIAVLLWLCVWSFCRAYYFAFYVVEHWIDPTFRFSSLTAFAVYWLRQRKRDN